MSHLPELKGRIALVTSAGRACPLAEGLASRGATVVLAMRDERRAEQVARRITRQTGNPHVHHLAIDFASLESVRSGARLFISRFGQLHLLVTDTVSSTREHLGPLLLANLLLDTMKQTGGGRVVRLGVLSARQQLWSVTSRAVALA